MTPPTARICDPGIFAARICAPGNVHCTHMRPGNVHCTHLRPGERPLHSSAPGERPLYSSAPPGNVHCTHLRPIALFRYREEIMEGMHRRMEGMTRRMEQLENNQRPLDPSLKRTGVLYVIRAAEGITAQKLGMSGMYKKSRTSRRSDSPVERVKLGYTSDFAKRLRSHGSARADALEVLYVYKTNDMVAVEACALGGVL